MPPNKRAILLEHGTSDLHMHLNGSFSLDFLQKIAEKNNIVSAFKKLREIKTAYSKMKTQEGQQREQDKAIAHIWAQFALIHQMIKTLADIEHGTVDVIQSSKAKYMEIRTSPKSLDGASWEQYVDAFVAGLTKGNEQCHGEKIARGLLSLDRTRHTETISYEIIDRVVSEKKRSGLLVGIDISGNPIAERQLTGDTLTSTLHYALSKEIGIAIHVGEVDTSIEINDVNIILDILNSFNKQHSKKNPFHGKVRFGHGIFLTETQRAKIKELQIPIEICPSCHVKLNWWDKNKPHPVTFIYPHWKDPVVTGTDDEIIFDSCAKTENHVVLEMLGYPKNKKKEEAWLHQSKFRFV